MKRILIKSAVCYLSVLGFELPIIYGLRAPIPTQMALGLISFVFVYYVVFCAVKVKWGKEQLTDADVNRFLLFQVCITLPLTMPIPHLTGATGGAMAVSMYYASISGRLNVRGSLNKTYLMALFFCGLVISVGKKLGNEDVTIGELARWWIGPVIGVILGQFVGVFLNRCIPPLLDVWCEIKALGRVLGGYSLGYLTLTVLFAGCYASIFRLNGGSLKGIPSDFGFVDYWFMSLSVLTTLGTSIEPVTPLAKATVALEVLLGLSWTLIVFSAVLNTSQQLNRAANKPSGNPENHTTPPQDHVTAIINSEH